MYSKKISQFSDFLVQSPGSYTEIAQFLVMDLLVNEGALSVYMGELQPSGVISPLGIFGWSPEEAESFFEFQFNLNIPICDSIRQNKMVIVTNGAAFYEQYPLMLTLNISQPWITGICLPIRPIGGIVILFAGAVELTDSKQIFLTAICSLLGLYANQISNPPSQFWGGKEVGIIKLASDALTDRQIVIAELIEQGFSNAQIGSKLGYSESLIRQETVTIYRKLGVNGRKTMQKNNAVRLEQAARGTFSN